MSLTQKIIISLILGILAGYLLGYPIQGTHFIGNAFVMLLQMTAIPYICVSLISGIGYLDRETALKLTKYGILVYLGITAIVLGFTFLSSIAFPNWHASSFYSSNTFQEPQEMDFLTLFIPSNPFFSLASSHVPAIVLFCAFIGVGFMSLEYRNQSLLLFKDMQQAIVNVNNLILKMAPLGVFCIAQHASATLSKEDIDGLVVYIVTVTFLTFVLSFVVLPGLIAIFSPFSYRQVIYVSKEALLTAFVTGHILVVLPIIAEKVKKLVNEYTGTESDEQNLSEVLAPISFSLPTGSKLISLSFIVFAAWFDGQGIEGNEYLLLSILGVTYLFNSNYAAIPDLLSDLRISSGLFDLFVVAENLIVRHLSGIIGAMFCVAFTLLTVIVATGIWRINLRKLAIFSGVTIILSTTLLWSISRGFEIITHQYHGYEKFIDRPLLSKPVEHKVLKEPPEGAARITLKESVDTLTKIRNRGFIRFGYYQDSLPFAFNNKAGQLVGLDIELIHLLARELQVGVEFVKVSRQQAKELLLSGYLDLASGIALITENLTTFSLSTPYTYEKIALVVRNQDHHNYKDLSQIRHKEGLRLGIPNTLFYREIIQQKFGAAKIEVLGSPRRFFLDGDHLDALLLGAAQASAWTLVYPDYSVVIPKQQLSLIPTSFPIPPNDHSFGVFLRNWISLNKENGNIDKYFSYWIEGKKPK